MIHAARPNGWNERAGSLAPKTRSRRRARCERVCTLSSAACLLTVCAFFAHPAAAAAPSQPSDVAALLVDAGIELDQLGVLAESVRHDLPLDAEQVALASETLHRLRQLGDVALAAPVPPAQQANEPGRPRRMSGEATSARPLKYVDEALRAAEELSVVTASDDGGPFLVVTPRTPHGWYQFPPSVESPQPIRAAGVQLSAPREENDPGPAVVLAPRIEWFPAGDAPAGWRWLAAHGFDVSLLDEVRHDRRFVDSRVSREGEAFHACLAAVAQGSPAELEAAARADVQTRLERLREQGDDAAGQPGADKSEQRTAALAAAEVERAELGYSSVAPLFLQPSRCTGKFVLLEGVVRRAVEVRDPADANQVSHYELELFPVDSQNLPIVCCAARLPAGFPVGDAIREQARIGGVFFKLWSFEGRPDGADAAKKTRGPIVVAAEPTWIRAPAEPASQTPAIIGAAAFVVVLAGMWFALGRAHRSEQTRRELAPLPEKLDGVE